MTVSPHRSPYGSSIDRGIAVCLALLLGLLATPALRADDDGEQGKPVERPRFSFLRQNEDWSVLDGVDRAQWRTLDRIKFVPLNRKHSQWASFGGSARGRLESWHNFAFGTPPNDDDIFSLWRFLAHADFHLGSRFRLFVEGKSALSGDRDLPGGERTIDADNLDLQQGFVDVVALESERNRVAVRLGRRGLQFGRQRLVSPLPWGNTLRSWDGASVILRNGTWNTTAFWTRPVAILKTEFNRPDGNSRFMGAYATRGRSATVDLYALGLQRDDVTFNGTAGDEDRLTLGGRYDTPLGSGGLRLEVEAGVQHGEVGSADIFAWMATVDLKLPRKSWPGSPVFRLVVDLASGDRDPGGDVETFNQLFPLGHAYLGIMDFVGRQNVAALSVPIAFRPHNRWSVSFTPHLFRRFESHDALYNAGGGVVFAGDAGSSRDVGTELDVVVAYSVNDYLKADAGFGHFFAGNFVEQAGGRNDMDFGYVQLEFDF